MSALLKDLAPSLNLYIANAGIEGRNNFKDEKCADRAAEVFLAPRRKSPQHDDQVIKLQRWPSAFAPHRPPRFVVAPTFGWTDCTKLPVAAVRDWLKLSHSGAGVFPVTIYKLPVKRAGANGGIGGSNDFLPSTCSCQ